jgi:hypothetical protein
MKVDVLQIFGHPGAVYADHVRPKLQQWLSNNPNASIEHVVQTPIAENGTVGHIIVTIFYRD